MIKLVAESLYELYGPGYVSDTTHPRKKQIVSEPQFQAEDNEEEDETLSTIPTAGTRSVPASFKGSGHEAGIDDDDDDDDYKRKVGPVAQERNWHYDNNGKPRETRKVYPPNPNTPYNPKEGSMPDKLFKFLKKHVGEKFSQTDFIKQFGDTATVWHGIDYLVNKGIVHVANELNPRSNRKANMYWVGSAEYEGPEREMTATRLNYAEPASEKRPQNDDDTGFDKNGEHIKSNQDVPFVNLKGKPYGYKTYALLKAINDSPDGFSQNGGFFAPYLTKANPEMVQRKSQSFGSYMGGGKHKTDTAMTRKDKWILSAEGRATLAKYEKKFKDI